MIAQLDRRVTSPQSAVSRLAMESAAHRLNPVSMVCVLLNAEARFVWQVKSAAMSEPMILLVLVHPTLVPRMPAPRLTATQPRVMAAIRMGRVSVTMSQSAHTEIIAHMVDAHVEAVQLVLVHKSV